MPTFFFAALAITSQTPSLEASPTTLDQQICEQGKGQFDRLDAFHKGSGPCVRRRNPCTAKPSMKYLESVARLILKIGVTPEAFLVGMADRERWVKEKSRASHARSEKDETFEAALQDVPPSQRAKLGPLLKEKIDAMFVVPAPDPKWQTKFLALPVRQRKLLRKAWDTYPLEVAHFYVELYQAMEKIEKSESASKHN